MEYLVFWKKLLGYEIRRKSDGCIVGKVGIFNKFQNDIESLEKLCDGTHKLYEKKEKEFYKDGIYVGPIEGAYPSRQFAKCPEMKPPPLKRIYDKDK